MAVVAWLAAHGVTPSDCGMYNTSKCMVEIGRHDTGCPDTALTHICILLHIWL